METWRTTRSFPSDRGRARSRARDTLVPLAAVAASLAVVTACSDSSYDRQVQIDYFMEEYGLTEERATCAADRLEAELGTDALDDAAGQAPDDRSAEFNAAFETAVNDCAFTPSVPPSTTTTEP